jgi:hypothetical protein
MSGRVKCENAWYFGRFKAMFRCQPLGSPILNAHVASTNFLGGQILNPEMKKNLPQTKAEKALIR